MHDNQGYLELARETEEFISAAEYLRRRRAGTISPEEVKIVPPRFWNLASSGFLRLKMPRYRLPQSLGRHER